MRKAWHSLRFWIAWPALFAYFLGSHRARILIVSGNKVLLVKDRSKVWFDDDRFTVPGGGIQRGETIREGAVRELQEELGITIEVAQLLPLWEGLISEMGLRYHAHFFLLRLSTSVELHLQANEIADARWLSVDNLQTSHLKPEAVRALRLLADH